MPSAAQHARRSAAHVVTAHHLPVIETGQREQLFADRLFDPRTPSRCVFLSRHGAMSSPQSRSMLGVLW